jgi:hypothetical protein
MRDTDYMKTNRHLNVKTYRDGVKVGVNVPVADPFHCTDVVCSWSFLDWLKMLFRRNRTTTIRVALDGDSVGGDHTRRAARENLRVVAGDCSSTGWLKFVPGEFATEADKPKLEDL